MEKHEKTGKELHEEKLEQRRLEKLREQDREEAVLDFIEQVLHQRPRGGDFESFIRDAVILSKLMTAIVFNSVPMEDIEENWGSEASRNRARTLIREMMRYGIRSSFEPEDLVDAKNVPKVTKCVEELARMASKDKSSLLAANRDVQAQ